MLKFFASLHNAAFDAVETLRDREEGQTMAEYGVVLGVITVLCIVAFTALSGGISGAISKVTGILPK